MSENEESAVSKRASQSETMANERDFSRMYPGEWKFRKDGAERIHSVSGGLIHLREGESILSLAHAMKNFLAEGDYDLEERSSAPETDLIRTHDVVQSVGDLQVYQGGVSFLSRKQDGAIYLINNRLKDIGSFSKEPRIGLPEAQRIMEEQFSDWKITPPTRPLVFSDNRITELAWIFRVRSEDRPPKVKEVALSAVDGRILHQEDRVISD